MGCGLSIEECVEDFKSFYYETALASDETTLGLMKDFVSVDKMLFGSDLPGKPVILTFSRETASN